MAGISKVLLAEDNADIIEPYSSVLKGRYEVAVVMTVDEALEKVKEFKPDFVFLDVMLPGGKSGLDALVALRTKPEYGCTVVPIVILTNLGLTDKLQQAWEEYADGYVIKAEILPYQLLDIIKSFANE